LAWLSLYSLYGDDEAAIRERHQLDQFSISANQIADDGLSVVIMSMVGSSICRRNYNVVVSRRSPSSEMPCNRLALADEIDYGSAPRPPVSASTASTSLPSAFTNVRTALLARRETCRRDRSQ